MTLPLVVDLRGRSVLVVGTSRGAHDRVARLVAEGAEVTLVAPGASGMGFDGVMAVDRSFEVGDLDHVSLVIAATGTSEENARVARAAAARGIFVNAVDDPPSCSCYFTAERRDGDVVVAVSTSGASPALAQWIRDRVASVLPPGLSAVASELRARRAALHGKGASTEGFDWRSVIEELLGPARDGDTSPSRSSPVTATRRGLAEGGAWDGT